MNLAALDYKLQKFKNLVSPKELTRFSYPFELRNYQKTIIEAIDKYQFIAVMLPRRAGKDLTSFYLVVSQALKKKGRYFYVAPTYKDLKNIIFDSSAIIDNVSYNYLDLIPKDVMKGDINKSDMQVNFVNGSSLRFINSDNPTKLRGITATGVVMTEGAFQKEDVLKILTPVMIASNGWLLINSTPDPITATENWFWKLLHRDTNNWFKMYATCETLLDEDNNRYITEDMVNRARENGMSESNIRCEYYCDPIADPMGTIFGIELNEDMKVDNYQIDNNLRVHVAVDIGMNDPTALLFFQIDNANNIYILHEYTDNNKPTQFYVDYILKYTRKYVLGTVFLPHDGKKRDINSIDTPTAEDVYRDFNIYTDVLARTGRKDEQIRLAKSYAKKIHIAKSCEKTLMMLRTWQYDKLRNKPLHDHNSHIGDAFLYMCVAYYNNANVNTGRVYEYSV